MNGYICMYCSRISLDRHKAELMRAVNDDRLFNIAKRLSHGRDEISAEWLKQCKRNVPLLSTFHTHSVLVASDCGGNSSSNDQYRVLADQILARVQPALNFYERDRNDGGENENRDEQEDEDEDVVNMSSEEKAFNGDRINGLDDHLLYLKNGYSGDSKNAESKLVSLIVHFQLTALNIRNMNFLKPRIRDQSST